MSDDHIKKIDGMNDRLIRLEERLPLQVEHLSGAIEDFRSEIGDAIRSLTEAVRDQAGFNETFRGHVSQQSAINERVIKVENWKTSMQKWQQRINRYIFAAFVLGTIVIWFLNQFISPLISRLLN